MTNAAAQARHLSLARLERAAGQAFGCEDDGAGARARPSFLMPSAITLATVATALAATITYLV